MLMLKDVQAAEAAYDQACAELRVYEKNPRRWSGHEEINERKLRALVLDEAHFERLEHLRGRVERARQHMIATRRAWLEGR